MNTTFGGIDDDDVVAIVHMRGEGRLVLPRRRIATIVARRPTTRPVASMTIHFFSMSAGVAEKVLMTNCPESCVGALLKERLILVNAALTELSPQNQYVIK